MSGSRLASLLLLSFGLLASNAWADAGSPAPEGASTRGTAGAGNGTASEETAEEASEADPEEEEQEEEAPTPETPDEEESPTASEGPPAPLEAAPRVLRAEAAGQQSPRSEVLGDATPGRRDFLRRLRTTAESIEQVRVSERTEAHTEGDLTVLSNVAPSPTEPGVDEVEPAGDDRAEEPPAAGTEEPRAGQASSPEVVLASTERAAASDLPSSGSWRWLWVLGGVATVLLVPIALLLTRATRNQ